MTSKIAIVIGANTKATNSQIAHSKTLGARLSAKGYICVHGGGEGIMLGVTEGINDNSKVQIIVPRFMKTNNKIYDNVPTIYVDTIHDRIGYLLKVSENPDTQYIVVYAGGIGTIHELMAFLVHYYDKPKMIPTILIYITSIEDQVWYNNLMQILVPLCTDTRPYMKTLMSRFIVVNI